MKKKYSIHDLQLLAKSKGGLCLSSEYLKSNLKLKWQCDKGHKWEALSSSILRGTWCPHCYGHVKFTIVDMQKLAESYNGKCLSKIYNGVDLKLEWKCEKEHTWETTPTRIINGSWCPYCAGIKLTIQDMNALAESHKGRCLSTEFFGSKIKLTWQCEFGHIWKTKYNDIKFNHSWCPYCYGNAKKTIQDMQNLADARGGKCLSIKYVNARSKLKWMCDHGHTWESVPDSVKRGTWCPVCNKGGTSNKYKINVNLMRV